MAEGSRRGAVFDHAAQRADEVVGETFDDVGVIALGAVDPPRLEAAFTDDCENLETMCALVRGPVPVTRRFVGEAEQLRARDDLIELAEIVEQQIGRPGGEPSQLGALVPRMEEPVADPSVRYPPNALLHVPQRFACVERPPRSRRRDRAW